MSRDPADVALGLFAAWNRRDLAAVLALTADDLEIDFSQRILNPDIYRGHAGMLRFIAEVDELWEEFVAEPQGHVVAGDRVLLRLLTRGRGRASGAGTQAEVFHVCTVRDGLITRIVGYWEEHEATAALRAG